MVLKIRAAAASDRGRRRESNEDHYLIDESLGLYVVCDGLGGHAAGEVAAERSIAFAAEYIRDHEDVLRHASDSPDGYFRVLELAEDATQEASKQLYELACSDSNWAGMGTTMTMLLVIDSKAILTHVGDSRLYMLRGGEMHQLTSDHTLANELLQAGGLASKDVSVSDYRHVLTRTIGQQELVQVESLLFDLFPGDTCLLCSDGLSNYFDDPTPLEGFLANEDLVKVAQRLIAFANAHGGADNITVVLLRAACSADESDALDIQRRLDVLRSTFLCRDFAVSRLMRVLNITSLIECAAGRRLLTAGQACDGLYVVLDGRLNFEDDMMSSELQPGECLGESSLLRPGQVFASVVAVEPSRLLFISRADFGKLVRRLPKLGNALLRNLGRQLSSQLDDLRLAEDLDLGDTATWDEGPS